MRWPSLGEAKCGPNSLHWAKEGDFLWVPHDWSCPSRAHSPLPCQPDAGCGSRTLPRGVACGGLPCCLAQMDAASGTSQPALAPQAGEPSGSATGARRHPGLRAPSGAGAPRAEARAPRGPPVGCWMPPWASALGDLPSAQDPKGPSWRAGLQAAEAVPRAGLARVGLLVPSRWKKAAQQEARRAGRAGTPGALRPRRRKCGHTRGRNPGAGRAPRKLGQRSHRRRRPAPTPASLLGVCRLSLHLPSRPRTRRPESQAHPKLSHQGTSSGKPVGRLSPPFTDGELRLGRAGSAPGSPGLWSLPRRPQ